MKKLLILITALLYTATCLQGMNNARQLLPINEIQIESSLCQFAENKTDAFGMILSFLHTPAHVAQMACANNSIDNNNAIKKLRYTCKLLHNVFILNTTQLIQTHGLSKLFIMLLKNADALIASYGNSHITQHCISNTIHDVDTMFAAIAASTLNHRVQSFILNDYNDRHPMKKQQQFTTTAITSLYQQVLRDHLTHTPYTTLIIAHNGYELASNILNNATLLPHINKLIMNITYAAKINTIVFHPSLLTRIQELELLDVEKTSLSSHHIEKLITTCNPQKISLIPCASPLPSYLAQLTRLQALTITVDNHAIPGTLFSTSLINIPKTVTQLTLDKTAWQQCIGNILTNPALAHLQESIPAYFASLRSINQKTLHLHLNDDITDIRFMKQTKGNSFPIVSPAFAHLYYNNENTKTIDIHSSPRANNDKPIPFEYLSQYKNVKLIMLCFSTNENINLTTTCYNIISLFDAITLTIVVPKTQQQNIIDRLNNYARLCNKALIVDDLTISTNTDTFTHLEKNYLDTRRYRLITHTSESTENTSNF